MLTVKAQGREPPKLEVWNPGKPVERVNSARLRAGAGRATGREAALQGRGVSGGPPAPLRGEGRRGRHLLRGHRGVVVGPYLPEGGKVQVYLDGKPERMLDVYSDEGNS